MTESIICTRSFECACRILEFSDRLWRNVSGIERRRGAGRAEQGGLHREAEYLEQGGPGGQMMAQMMKMLRSVGGVVVFPRPSPLSPSRPCRRSPLSAQSENYRGCAFRPPPPDTDPPDDPEEEDEDEPELDEPELDEPELDEEEPLSADRAP